MYILIFSCAYDGNAVNSEQSKLQEFESYQNIDFMKDSAAAPFLSIQVQTVHIH